MIICPFEPYGPTNGAEHISPILRSKFYGIVSNWNYAASLSFANLPHMVLAIVAHLTHMGFPMGTNAYLFDVFSPFEVPWNCLDL